MYKKWSPVLQELATWCGKQKPVSKTEEYPQAVCDYFTYWRSCKLICNQTSNFLATPIHLPTCLWAVSTHQGKRSSYLWAVTRFGPLILILPSRVDSGFFPGQCAIWPWKQIQEHRTGPFPQCSGPPCHCAMESVLYCLRVSGRGETTGLGHEFRRT